MKNEVKIAFKKLYIISAFILILFFFLESSIAGVTPPWTFSFDCGREYILATEIAPDDWWDFYNCENGVGPNVNSAVDGRGQEIFYDANNPSGVAGSAGSRQWVKAGKNHQTGGVGIKFNSGITEFWFRWYVKWEYGFWWSYLNGQKMAFFNMNTCADVGGNCAFQAYNAKFNAMGFHVYANGDKFADANLYQFGWGWDDLMANGPDSPNNDGHKASDGKWHYFEIHIKFESSASAQDGIAEMWVDGVKRASFNNVHFGNLEYGHPSGLDTLQIPSNYDSPGFSGFMYHLTDDFALSTTGYIGPLGGNNGENLQPPTNLKTTP